MTSKLFKMKILGQKRYFYIYSIEFAQFQLRSKFDPFLRFLTFNTFGNLEIIFSE